MPHDECVTRQHRIFLCLMMSTVSEGNYLLAVAVIIWMTIGIFPVVAIQNFMRFPLEKEIVADFQSQRLLWMYKKRMMCTTMLRIFLKTLISPATPVIAWVRIQSED